MMDTVSDGGPEQGEERTLYKMSAADKVGSLTRQKAVRRKGYAWGQTLSRPSGEKGGTKDDKRGGAGDTERGRRSSGSSLDLAPTLLTIYDNIAAANGSTEAMPGDKMDARSKSLPASATVRHSSGPVARIDSDPKLSEPELKMADLKGGKHDHVDGDVGKKRPLSISSSSSASSSSLPRPQHKRPNLADYEHLLSSKTQDNNSKCGSEDFNGNSKMDYSSSCVQSEEKMEGVEEASLQLDVGNKLDAGGSTCRVQSAMVDKLTRCVSPMSLSTSLPVSSPEACPLKSPPVSSPESSPLKSPVSSSTASPLGSSSPTATAVKEDTAKKKSRSPSEGGSSSRNPAQSRAKSPPSQLGVQISSGSSTQSRSSPASPKSPGNGSKDGGSPDGKQGSLYVSYVQRVVSEIVETERTYVRSLEDIIQGYLEYLEKVADIGARKEDMKCLFGNIRNIYDFGRVFLWELEQCEGDPVRVAECFVRNNKGFVIYTDYCTNYPSAVEVLTRYMSDPSLSEMFKLRQLALGHGLPLGAYLLRPVQRILKYHLLLQNILKFFDKDKEGYDTLNKAFKHMTEMAHHINEMKRKHEHAVRIQEIQSQLEDYGGEDLTRLGELVLEGPFRVYGAKASRQVFLFEREILISKKKEGGMLGCKSSIQLANLMLVEIIPNEPLSFHLIPFDNPRAQFTLQARNMEQKRRWCQEIKRLILDTYKGKIPDKVKSLVMELGRNHDDDYVNSENLDPRRSHHTAPEYLERRRGRRKSGGRLPDLLKPQKGKRGSSGNRKHETSPRTSPLLDRRQTQPSLLPSRQRELTEDVTQSSQSIDEASARSRTSTTATRGDPSKLGSEDKMGSQKMTKSAEDILYTKTDETSDKSAADNVRRAKSFRMATRMRPIRSVDMGDEVPRSISDDSEEDDPNLTQDGLREYNDLAFGSRSDFDELSDEEGPTKQNGQNRYASMPILNVNSPKASVDIKVAKKSSGVESVQENGNADSWRRKQQQVTRGNMAPKRWSNTIKPGQGRSIPAFHDTFSKKSRDNRVARGLCHPVYAVKHLSVDGDSVAKKGGNAKLTNWGSCEKLTKGSMNDLSHLSDNPWVKKPEAKKPISAGSASNADLQQQVQNARKHPESNEQNRNSRENLDWMVYMNRNSLQDNGENLKYFTKYCTPPRGSMTPPKSPTVKTSVVESISPKVARRDNNLSPMGNAPRPVSTYDSVPDIAKVSVASSVPSIIVSSTSPKTVHHGHFRHHLARSNSTPLTKTKVNSHVAHNQSSSFDCSHVEIVAEMEDYMKNSETNSSPTCKFPTSLPSFHYDHPEKGNRGSNISTSSYESHSSSSSEGIMDTLKHKIHNLTSKFSKRMDDSDAASGMSSVSDLRPSSMVLSDDEKADDGKSKNSSSETLDSPQMRRKAAEKLQRQQQLLLDDEELQTFLRERGLGGGSIGSRMANSLPPNVEALLTDKLRPHSACVLRDNDSLSSYELSSKETTPEPQSRFSLPIMSSPTENLSPPTLNKSDIQQSDSGFSMQSDITDTNSFDNSLSTENITPTAEHTQNVEMRSTDDAEAKTPVSEEKELGSPVGRRRTQSESSADSVDSFYERRLSIAFDSEVFQDNPIFCDVNSDPKQKVMHEQPRRPRKSIKDFVQLLEERNRPKRPQTMEVKRREPGSVIRQRLQTLQQASQYSRPNSRNCSEERELLPPKSVRDIQHSLIVDSHGGRSRGWYPGTLVASSRNSSSNTSISSSCSSSYASAAGVSGPHFAVLGGGGGNQFMHHHTRAESEHGRESSPEMCGGLRSARSLGRLDQLSTDIENLVIMKGWVRSLINKFQCDKD